MPKHVNCRLRLLQNDVPDKWFVLAVPWLHIYEQHFGRDGTEALDLNAYRSTRRGLELDGDSSPFGPVQSGLVRQFLESIFLKVNDRLEADLLIDAV